MRNSSWLKLILAAMCVTAAYASDDGSSTCRLEVAGIRFICPTGWSILNQDHARPGEITIGDFSPRMKNLIPAGKNTITLLPKPALYATVDEWISATVHMASDEKQTTETFTTETGKQITAQCFRRDPALRKPGDQTCIFVIGGRALMLDLFISPKATDVDALRRNFRDMINTAKP